MSDPSSSPVEGRGGLGLLFLFALATFLVVVAVWAVGALGGWWVLGVAMAIHLGMTAAVLWGLARALADRSEPPTA
ncbi:MAG TPA: hypothetical protein VF032_15755 [Thermoleophilaceae bacterium]